MELGFINNIIMYSFGLIPLASFLIAFFAGEESIFLLSVFVTRISYPIWIVFLFCLLGTLTADCMWFFLGRIKYLSKLKKIKYIHKNYSKAKDFINKTTKENDFILLAVSKILYGIGILVIMYLGRKIRFSKFLFYNFIIVFFETFFIVTLGWLTGIGFGWVWDTYKSIQLIIFLLICILIIIYFLRIILSKIISKWLKK